MSNPTAVVVEGVLWLSWSGDNKSFDKNYEFLANFFSHDVSECDL